MRDYRARTLFFCLMFSWNLHTSTRSAAIFGAIAAAAVAAPHGAQAQTVFDAPLVSTGGLYQLRSGGGCFTQRGNGVTGALCRPGKGILAADSIAISPDGRHVYLASRGPDHLIDRGSNGVSSFARDETGALHQLQCITDDGTDGRPRTQGACTDGEALGRADDLAISPDGRNVYVASGDGGLAIFARDTQSGRLQETGCFKDEPGETGCRRVNPMPRAVSVTVSPDGSNVYVTSRLSHAVITFGRDQGSGQLTPLSCITKTGTSGWCLVAPALHNPTALAVSPDGKFAYVTSAKDVNAVVVLARDAREGVLVAKSCVRQDEPEDGECSPATGLADAADVLVSPDGRHVYVAAIDSAAVSTFARDAESGAIYQVDCVADREDGYLNHGCRAGLAMSYAAALAMPDDGRSLFVTGAGDSTLSLYQRNRATGRLRMADCIVDVSYGTESSCSTVRGLFGTKGLAVTRDGADAYTASDTGNSFAFFGVGARVSSDRAFPDRRGRVRIQIGCPPGTRVCAGTVRLRSARRVFNEYGVVERPRSPLSRSGRFRIAPGRRVEVAVPLLARARARLRSRVSLRAIAVLRDRRSVFAARRQAFDIDGSG